MKDRDIINDTREQLEKLMQHDLEMYSNPDFSGHWQCFEERYRRHLSSYGEINLRLARDQRERARS